jgi:hypothetical protein
VNDEDVRALVREAVQKHLGQLSMEQPRPAPAAQPLVLTFSRYKVERVSDDGMCLIEPAVRCNHCGYCECHGH